MIDHIIVDGGDELFYIEISITGFRNYINSVEFNFENQENELLEKYTQILLKRQEEIKKFGKFARYKHKMQEPTFHDDIRTQLHEVAIEFVQRFRNSIIIQLYSFLESELKAFCNAHQLLTNSTYGVDDLKGSSDLEKIKKYMTKSMNIEIGKSKLWPFINNFRILRNKIAHENSTIKTSDENFKNLEKFAKGNFNLQSNSPEPTFYRIYFNDRNFIDSCVNNVEIFMLEVMNKTQSM
jgi:hypothetical protein